MKCTCAQQMGRPKGTDLWVHLAWCEEGEWVEEYESLPWWKKLLSDNPHKWRIGIF